MNKHPSSNKLKEYTSNYYTQKYKDSYNTYENGKEETAENRIYENQINQTIYFGMNKLNADWKLKIYIFNGLTEKTNMDNLINWSSVYYHTESDSYFNFTKIFDMVKEENEDYRMFDILMKVRELIFNEEYVEITTKSYGNKFTYNDCETYEAFIMKLMENSDTESIDMSSISWIRLYEDMNGDSLLDRFLEPAKLNGKNIMKYQFLKYNEFKLV